MRNYEVTLIFPAREEEFTKGKTFVDEEWKRQGANILKNDDMGERDLAYPIKKETRGHYYFYEIEINPQKVIEVDRAFRLQDEIIKFLFVKEES